MVEVELARCWTPIGVELPRRWTLVGAGDAGRYRCLCDRRLQGQSGVSSVGQETSGTERSWLGRPDGVLRTVKLLRS